VPINLETHDPDVTLTPGTTKSEIVMYLYQHPELGFRPAEIRDALDVPRGTVTTTLKRLYEDDYVGKTEDGYYYALSHRDDLHRYVASHEQLTRMFTDRSADVTDSDEDDSGELTDPDLGAEVDDLEDELETDLEE
jgi:Mn-dependent DtxR family transcriptional regulator